MSELSALLEPIRLERPLFELARLLEGERFGALIDGAFTPRGRSYLCAAPHLLLSAKRVRGRAGWGAIEVERDDAPVERFEGRPLDVLRALLSRYAVPTSGDGGFRAGAVGYLGYEAGHFIEELPDRGEDELGLPDLCVGLCDAVVGHDHATGRSWISAVGRAESAREARRSAERAAEALLDRISKAPRGAPEPWTPSTLAPLFDASAYAERVARAQEHIRAGDAFEICFTHRAIAGFDGDPWALYAALRAKNPAPHAALMRVPGGWILSSSPERFLRVEPGGLVETRPIKGTRPRGATPEADRREREALAESEKDRAENLMIVDLSRSDLGRVARVGSVSVPELCAVEAHPTVHQLVSTVRAELAEGAGPVELLEATFPPGSMTGAPKIEAMKIIDALEPVDRGPYSGALGWIDYAGHLDLSVLIRTIVLARGRASVGSGGAVTLDSEPEAEEREAALKARALVELLRGGGAP